MAGSGKRHGAGAAVLVAALVMTACGMPREESEPVAGALGATASVTFMTEASGTVIERDGRTDLCFTVFQPYPPACGGGVELAGWDWEAVDADYDERTGVHWGDFTITGTYDTEAQILTVVSVMSPSKASPMVDPMGPILPSRCPAPEGGGKIVDETRATYEDLLATYGVAANLVGYATAWVDRSEIPPVPPGTDVLEQMRLNAVTAGATIVNVGIRSDPAAAEAQLRKVWGGALCVFEANYTAAELDARLQEIMASHQIMTAGPDALTGVITIQVLHDTDGALQQQMDQDYGPGAVVVSSILVPR